VRGIGSGAGYDVYPPVFVASLDGSAVDWVMLNSWIELDEMFDQRVSGAVDKSRPSTSTRVAPLYWPPTEMPARERCAPESLVS